MESPRIDRKPRDLGRRARRPQPHLLAIFGFNLYMWRIDIWPDHWAASPRTVRRTFQTLSKFDDRETGAMSRLIPRAQPQ
jgi:hypothetical protein